MKSMTPRAAVAIAAIAVAALALAACDEPTKPLVPSAPRSLLGAGSVAGSTIAYRAIELRCGIGGNSGCGDEGPDSWGWGRATSVSTIGADGTGLVNVTYPMEDLNITHTFEPAWSPDGMRLAFHDEGEIFVVAGAGGTPLNLTRNAADDRHPAWSPDGSRIAFSSDRGGSRELYVMSATDGSNVGKLTNGVGFSGHADWSADGARILFDCIVEVGNSDVCVVNANGTGFVRVTTHPSADFGADWSPTGRIAFATTRFGAVPEIAVMDGDGSGVSRLGAGIVGEDPDWSPDGGRLAFSRDLYVYTRAADGSNEALLAFGTSPAWRPSDAPLPAVQSPVARLGTPSCVELTCTFDASGSTDDAGTQSIAYYMWTVDGIGGYSATPTWKQSFAEPGTHTVRVTIGVYATGLTATATQSVTVTGLPVGAPPVASFTHSCAGLTCTLDGRGSTDDAAVTRYSWNIGYAGETMTGAVVNAIYPSEGSRTVVLTVSDAAGQTSSTTRTLYAAPSPGDAPPVARVNVYCVELQCEIDASASSDDKSLRGIYIDTGKPGSTPIWTSTLTTVYSAGTYTVTATAVDDAGQMGRATKTITVSPLPPPNQPPVASFAYSCVRTKCTFDGRSSTDDAGIVSYAWNLGSPPGGNLTGAVVTHDYKRSGTYTARLTVRDAAGLVSSVARTVTVTK